MKNYDKLLKEAEDNYRVTFWLVEGVRELCEIRDQLLAELHKSLDFINDVCLRAEAKRAELRAQIEKLNTQDGAAAIQLDELVRAKVERAAKLERERPTDSLRPQKEEERKSKWKPW